MNVPSLETDCRLSYHGRIRALSAAYGRAATPYQLHKAGTRKACISIYGLHQKINLKLLGRRVACVVLCRWYSGHITYGTNTSPLVGYTDSDSAGILRFIGMVGSGKMADLSNSGTIFDCTDRETLENWFPVPEKWPIYRISDLSESDKAKYICT